MSDDLSDSERREFFRVFDAIALQVEPLDSTDSKEFIEQFETHRKQFLCSPNDCGSTAKSHAAIEQIQSDYPVVADYIQELEERINALVSEVEDTDGSSKLLAVPTHKVNISGGGLSFGSGLALMPDQYVVLKFQLFPEKRRMMAVAKTIRCIGSSCNLLSGEFAIGAEFIHINESDREFLLKHIQELQISSLQLKKRGLLTAFQ